jgi:hypothetical protein
MMYRGERWDQVLFFCIMDTNMEEKFPLIQ